MIIDEFDARPHARRRLQDFAQQREIDFVVRARVARRVHQLDREIDALGRRVRPLRRHDVLPAQDRRRAFDQDAGTLAVIGDHGLADEHALAGLELHLQGHDRVSASGCSRHGSGRRVNGR